MKLHIAENLSLPLDIAGRRTAVFGISGSGKSNTATVIVESLLDAGEQVVLIDPKGEAWGLLSLANGKPSNLPVIIFGEPNGHIATLAESHGPRLADFVVDTGQSVALSLLGFESDQSERRFVATFLRQLYRRKSRLANPTRTLVVFEEAHLFVPETVRGDGAELAGAVQRIVRQGRSFGIGSLLIDQRPQDVSKRVVTQCDTLICHQLAHNLDRAALSEWVRGYDTEGRGKTFLESLATLEPGEAWIWSPAWLKLFKRAKIHRRKTFDSGAAPDGSAAVRKVQRAEVDLDSLRGQLAEIVEKAKADDPKELRQQIAKLKAELQKRPAETKVETKEVRVEVPVLRNGQLDKALSVIERLRGIVEALSVIQRLRGIVEPLAAAIGRATKPPVPHLPSAPTPKPRPAPMPLPAPRPAADIGDLPIGERKTLAALIQFPAGLRREQLTVLTGYKRSSRDAYLQRLRERGYCVTNSDFAEATAEGIAALPDAEPLPTGQALQDYWRQRLPIGERAILEQLLAAYPSAVNKDSLSDATGYQRSSRDAYLQRLRAKQLIEEPTRGEVAATKELFE